MKTLRWNHYLAEDGLFIRAFAPLRERLNAQAEAAGPHGFMPWVMRAGKGGDAQYIGFYDVSLYRHCMDVALIGFMLFVPAWQNGHIPDPNKPRQTLTPEDEAGAEKLLRLLFAVAFLHDADKYEGGGVSSSPGLAQVEALHADLAVETWAEIDAKTALALISVVEKMRGIGQGLRAGAKPTPTQEFIAELVGWGDAIVSEGGKTGVTGMIQAYNKRLPSLARFYGLADTPLRLLRFRYHPVVLQRLQTVFLDRFYAQGEFPLLCLLDGQHLSVSVPEGFDLETVFEELERRIGSRQPDLARIPTSGEVPLYNVESAAQLREAVRRALQRNDGDKLLCVKAADYDAVLPYLSTWAREAELALAEVGSGQFLLTVQGENDSAEYRYAVTLAVALRGMDEKNTLSEKQFNERVARLSTWNSAVRDGLTKQLPGMDLMDLEALQKDTRQTLFALAAALLLEDDEHLEEAIDACYGEFPAAGEDEGARAIIAQLKTQCGLASGEDAHPPYAPHPAHPKKAGTCVLCNAPAATAISGKLKTQIKTSAFYNGMGHRKSIWSQDATNYLCPACIKQQSLLLASFPKLRAEPIMAATPFRGLVKGSFEQGEDSALRSYQIYVTDSKKGKTWRDFLPWNLDLSGHYPLALEEAPSGFEDALKAMQRWARFALLTGNPVHVFVAAQRDLKASFLFEQTPPLLARLLEDLSVSAASVERSLPQWQEQYGEKIARRIQADLQPLLPGEQGAIRRNHLPALVERLHMFQDMLGLHNGFDALSALPDYGWWAAAWLHQRLHRDSDKQKQRILNSLLNIAEKHYPMNESQENTLLKEIATAAAQIQRYPGWDSANNDKRFCLNHALEQYEIGVSNRLDATTTIAAIAGVVGDNLLRRDMHTGRNSQFPQRCEQFAEKFYAFMRAFPSERVLDPRFQRFLLAAYAHLFMQASLAKSQENKEKYQTAEAENA